MEILSYDNRPSDDTLINNILGINVYHSFAPNINFQIDDTLSLIDNPESLLVGVLQSNQSLNQNLFNVRLNADFSEKHGAVFKYRNTNFAYDDNGLAELLDRNQHLIGVEGNFNHTPLMTFVGEFRYQDINYDQSGLEKNSDSIFFLGGINYNPDEKIDIRGRFGVEDRDRISSSDNTSFYGEFTGSYRYQEESFLSAGVTYDIRETSNPLNFTDDEVLSLFINAQHTFSGAFTISGSVLYNASELLQRDPTAGPNVEDDTVRVGFGLTYKPSDNLAIIIDYDFDNTTSDDPVREENRHRVGINFRYTFGLF